MENTGLIMGRDKNVPLRVLVLGLDFYLFNWVQLPLLPCLAIREFELGNDSQVQVKVGCGESELLGDALDLGMSFLASFCQAKEGRGLK